MSMTGRQLLQLLKYYPAPLRAEIMILCLLEELILIEDRTFLKPSGLFLRDAHSSEIVDVEELPDMFGYRSRVEISVAREGLYDALPNGIFRQKTDPGPALRGREEVAEAHRDAMREEAAARGFFLPIDQEFFSIRIGLERQKKELLHGLHSEKLRKELWVFWVGPPPPEPDPVREAFFLSVLPGSANRLRSLRDHSLLLSNLLRLPTTVLRTESSPVEYKGETEPLGSARLGGNSILGQTIDDGLPSLLINIGPIPVEDVDQYLEHEPGYHWVTLYIRFFLPAGMKTRLQLEVEPKDHYFSLDNSPGTARLGLSTVLSSPGP